MANGRSRFRPVSVADLIAQFGQLGPGGNIEAGTAGFERGIDIATRLQQAKSQREQFALKRQEIQQKIKQAEQEAKQEQQRQQDISRLAELQAQTPLTPTGQQIAPVATGTRLVPPPTGQEGPAAQEPVAAPRPELLGEDFSAQLERATEINELERRLFPEEFVKAGLKKEKEIETVGPIISQEFNVPENMTLNQFEALIDAREDLGKPRVGTVTSFAQLNDDERKTIAESEKRLAGNKVLLDGHKTLAIMSNLKRLLQINLAGLSESLKGQIARAIATETGRLTEFDVERAAGSPALGRRFKRFKVRLTKGTIAPEERTDFLQGIDEIADGIQRNANAIHDNELGKLSTKFPTVSSELLNKLVQNRPNFSVFQDTPDPVAQQQQEALDQLKAILRPKGQINAQR